MRTTTCLIFVLNVADVVADVVANVNNVNNVNNNRSVIFIFLLNVVVEKKKTASPEMNLKEWVF